MASCRASVSVRGGMRVEAKHAGHLPSYLHAWAPYQHLSAGKDALQICYERASDLSQWLTGLTSGASIGKPHSTDRRLVSRVPNGLFASFLLEQAMYEEPTPDLLTGSMLHFIHTSAPIDSCAAHATTQSR